MTTIIWPPQSLRDLEAFPESGRVVPELDQPQIREVVVKPYRVVYRYRGEVVEIATVFRSSRQIPEIAWRPNEGMHQTKPGTAAIAP